MTCDLSHLLRHAERHGTEQVWETAVQLHLPAVSLMRLADRLTSLDSKWRLPAASKPALARELLEQGWEKTRIAKELGVPVAAVEP